MHIFYKVSSILIILTACYYSYLNSIDSKKDFKSPILLIGIMSSRSNFEHREAIRTTWLSNLPALKNNGRVDAVFVIGKESCPIPPDNRWDINSCSLWDVQLPNSNETQWACQLNTSISKRKIPYRGLSIKIRHPIIVTKLGVLKTVFRYNSSATVVLLNAVSEEIIVKVQFSPIKKGVDIAGYYYLPINPIVLPKNFEATLILENEVDGVAINLQHVWNSAHRVFSFTRVIQNDYYSTKWRVDALSAVIFGFTIYDYLGLKNHIAATNKRQQQWDEHLLYVSFEIEKELSTHNDILLIDVVDTYRNLPLKLLQFYKIAAKIYKSEFIMKTDDDVFLNVPDILRELENLKSTYSVSDKIWWSRFRINLAADRVGKWAELDYESLVYPPFACGLGNVISQDLLHWLARNTEELHPYQGEDVSLGIWLAAIGPNRDFSWQCDSGCTKGAYNVGQLKPFEIQNAWTSMKNCFNMCGCDSIKDASGSIIASGDKLITNPGVKVWHPKINFTNPADWSEGQLPRSCDRAVIPALSAVSVNFASNLLLRELVLPLEGEIVLSEGSSLTFGAQSSDCKDPKDVQYNPPSVNSWYEPSSWSVPVEEEENRTLPIPESERVPCQYDSVEFPVNSSYRVSIGGPTIKITSLLIDGKSVNTNEFSRLEKTSSGKIRFSRSTPLDVTNVTCSDQSGCVCRDEDRSTLICQLTNCKVVDCSDPVKPIGGCCALCGAFLIADCKNDFDFSRLKKLYDLYINKDEYKNVYGYLSKLDKNRVQVVFADSFETHRASSLAIELADILKDDIAGVGIYGISSVQFQISSHWLIPGRFAGGLSVGGVFGVSFAFICILILGLYAYVTFKKYGFGNLSFGRLDEDKYDSDESDEEQVVTPFAPIGGIENPLYEQEKKKDLFAETSDLVTAESDSAVVSTETRENPAFMVFEELKHLEDMIHDLSCSNMGSSKKHKEKEKERDREVREPREPRSRRNRSKSPSPRSRSRDRHRRDRRVDRSRSRSKERERSKKARDYDEKVRNRDDKSDSDAEVKGSAGGDSSLSIEETNKLRAKLGLKPLDVGKDSKDDEWKFDKEFVHKPAENWGDKKMVQTLRERISVQKEKRKIGDKLKSVKTLGDSDSDDEGALNWVLKTKQKQEEKEKAAKRAKMLEEMDEEFGIGDLVEDELKRLKGQAYSSRDLKGMTVQHDQGRFSEGRSVILTLKDKDVLNEDDDVLVNVNLIDNEKAEKNIELRKQKPGYDAYEEAVDEFGNLLARKPILKKYDEEIEGVKSKSFQLGSGGNYDLERQRQLQEIRRKLQTKNSESLTMPLPSIASEYYTTEEMVKFKKPKKISKVRKPKRLKADELAALASAPASSSKSKTDLKSRTIKQEPESPRESTSENENSTDIDVGWVKKEEPMELDFLDTDDLDAMGPDEDLTGVPVEPDEAELELQYALNKARKLKQKQDAIMTDIKAQPATAMEEEDGSPSKGPKGSIILNSTAEFCRALGDIPTYGLSGNRDEDPDELLEFDRNLPLLEEKRHIEDDNKSNQGGWNEVDIDEKPIEVQVTNDVPILEEEPDVSVGLAGALKLAMKKGYLEKESKKLASAPRHSQLQAANYTIEDKSFVEDDKYGRRDRYCAGPLSDFKEKDTYKPDVKLEYIDDNGRLLTPKEAFRYLSHKFHGKGSGKNKTEKRMKKLQEEALMKQMSSTDTPLGTLALLQEKQKQTQSPYILLSGGNKALNPNAISKAV
uniref:Uncharacterized protein n=1 Tax=Strigamia maritima TaxID=126957 RepID=T1IPV0_STRMM